MTDSNPDGNSNVDNTNLVEVDRILRSIEAMIWSIISSFHGLEHEDKNDLKQDVLLYVYSELMPKYESNRGAKFSSFAYKCIVNFIRRRMYMKKRMEMAFIASIPEYYDRFGHGVKTMSAVVATEKINALVELLKRRNHPFSVKERAVIAILHDNLDITQREVARIMGYSHPSAVSMIISRMRKKMKTEQILQTL